MCDELFIFLLNVLLRVADWNFLIYREQFFSKSVEMSVEGETGQQFKDAEDDVKYSHGYWFSPKTSFFVVDEGYF